MELLFVGAAAVVAWVAGAIWYWLFDGPRLRLSGAQAENTGHPAGKSAAPYLLHGFCLLIVAATMRALFLHGGIQGLGNGLLVGATLGGLVVTPFVLLDNMSPPRPALRTAVEGGHAILVCAIMGAILAAL